MAEADRAGAHRYLLSLGSNMRAAQIGGPREVIGAAVAALEVETLRLLARSPILGSEPIGPSRRRYANAAVVVETAWGPPELLDLLHRIERAFGRRRTGQRWRARPLDIDIVLWSGGIWVSEDLAIPHPHFRERAFVMRPAAQIAPHWHDPISGLTLRQLERRLARRASRQ
ncbi:MAG: 2-amino-4-hydroxy-6-hydroxymethyldihydropteridine diphosphokinase [Qipengyuania sp.]